VSVKDNLTSNQDIDEERNILLIGGTSSLSEMICALALSEGFQVFSTYRNKEKIFLSHEINWIHLDFNEITSVEGALSQLRSKNFLRIIYLVGELSDLQKKEIDFLEVDKYFKRNVSIPVWFLKLLLETKFQDEHCTFTYLSSRASQLGSNDYCYGIAKASIENFVKSISLLNSINLEMKIVFSGLILESAMQQKMSEVVVNNHLAKSMNKLIDRNLASAEIWEIANTVSGKSLETFQIGPQYL